MNQPAGKPSLPPHYPWLEGDDPDEVPVLNMTPEEQIAAADRLAEFLAAHPEVGREVAGEHAPPAP